MSFGKYTLRCYASGQDYTSYTSEHRPDESNSMPCPVCGKLVKLRAKYPKARGIEARVFIVIPYHNRAAIKESGVV